MRRALCLVLLLALLLPLTGCGGGKTDAAPLTLWCAADDPLLPVLRDAAESYNRSRKSGAPAVSLREFEDAEALTNALNTARPDLLLCSHMLAFSLADRGLLADSGFSLPYPEDMAARAEGLGRSVFPLGTRVQLLVSREEVPADLTALCALAGESGGPFLAADSYTDLLCQAVLGSGEFHADREKDCFSAAFREVWNVLAEAAFAGGITAGDASALSLLESGLPVAYVYSDSLASGVPAGFVLTAPGTQGLPLLGDLRCLAVTAGDSRSQHGAATFLRWLFSGARPARMALEAGLVPALPGGEGTDALSALLLSLRERSFFYADGGSDYVKNRAAFERETRRVLDLLK